MIVLAFEAPHGPAMRFALLALVIVIFPLLAERVKIPGMVGLLIGGMIIGPYVTGWITEADSDIPSLGQLGLLYLMFGAGVELDLNLFRRHRRAAIVFALLTFAAPQLLGMAVGGLLSYSLAAAALLGSLFASHTLVVYPAVRDAGLARDPAVAATVGATIITDTLSLIVLAVVAGTQTGDASGAAVAVELVLGFATLTVFTMIVLPRVVRWAFRTVATDRHVRFVLVLASFLTAAMVGEVFGIEAIVGAFFAGLGLNGVIPTGSVLMEKLEFFGSSFLIPTFLVSVGLLIDPQVMIQPKTLALGLLFTAACLGGKAIAAFLTKPLLGFSGAQTGVVYALSSPQAAATLAAAFVGFEIGLFGVQVVNAILVVVVISLILAPAASAYFAPKVPKPDDDGGAIGRRVLLPVGQHDAPALLQLAARLAVRDAGVLLPVYVAAPHAPPAQVDEAVEQAEHMIAAAGIDAEVHRRSDHDHVRALLNASRAERASMIVAGWDAVGLGRWRDAVDAESAGDGLPAVVASLAGGPITRVVVLLNRTDLGRTVRPAVLAMSEIAGRLRAPDVPVVVVSTLRSTSRVSKIVGVDAVETAASTADWVTTNARPGDLVLLPLGRSWEAVVAEASLFMGRPGVSVAMVTPATSGARTLITASGLHSAARA